MIGRILAIAALTLSFGAGAFGLGTAIGDAARDDTGTQILHRLDQGADNTDCARVVTAVYVFAPLLDLVANLDDRAQAQQISDQIEAAGDYLDILKAECPEIVIPTAVPTTLPTTPPSSTIPPGGTP